MPYLILPAPSARTATHRRDSDAALVRVLDLTGRTVQGGDPSRIVATLDGLTALPPPPPPPAPLPAVLPAWRVHAAAAIAGLTSTINTILGSLPEPQRTVATLAWTQGNEIERASATYQAVVSALAIDADTEAALWRQAAELSV